MLKLILSIFALFSYAYGYDLDKLLDEALQEVERENSERHYNLALKLFNEGLYRQATKNGEIFLQKNRTDIKKIDDVVLLLSSSYFLTGKKDKLFNLFLQYYRSGISEDTKRKMFIYTNNLLLKEEDWQRLKIVRRKGRFITKTRREIIKLSGVYSKFEPGVNIFRLKMGNIIGENSVFFADKNLTLIEIAKMLDMGYDELKIANPHIDPFDIQKGEAVFVPRRRLLPEKDFKFGTIYINLSEKRLYYPVVLEGEPYVITFPVGIGRDNAKSPIGEFKITQKKENPSWVVPESIREEDPTLPPVVPPGPDNPLGVRAMRLGYTEYLLHGTSKRFGIGMKVSHGCIRMYNRDVVRLFNIVERGTDVVITEKGFKFFKDSRFYLEIFNLKREDLNKVSEMLQDKGIKISPYLLMFYNKEKRGYTIPLL